MISVWLDKDVASKMSCYCASSFVMELAIAGVNGRIEGLLSVTANEGVNDNEE